MVLALLGNKMKALRSVHSSAYPIPIPIPPIIIIIIIIIIIMVSAL
jgi:hypothetical protein